MKILVKQRDRKNKDPLVEISDPIKEKELLRIIDSKNYMVAIRYLLGSSSGKNAIRSKKKKMSDGVGLVLTPASAHWDLMDQK